MHTRALGLVLVLASSTAWADGLMELTDNIGAAAGSTGAGDADPEVSFYEMLGTTMAGWVFLRGVFAARDPQTNGEVPSLAPRRGPPENGQYFYFAVQPAAETAGSLSFDARLKAWAFALDLRASRYREVDARLDLWAVAANARPWRNDDSELWAELGYARINTLNDLSLGGVVVGARLEHHLIDFLGLNAEAHGYVLEHGVRATELRTAFQIWVLSLSYRLLDFNVGPPMHGFEVGLTLKY